MAKFVVQPAQQRKRAVHPAAVVLAGVITLSACSSVPDYANPVEWYRGVADWVTGSDTGSGLVSAATPAEQRAPDSKQPFPSLATTPKRPIPTPAEQRQQIAEGLAADRDQARYTDEVLRRGPHSSDRTQVAAAPPQPPPAAAPAEPQAPARSPVRSETASALAPVPVPPPAPQGAPPPPPSLERVTPLPAPLPVTRTLTAPPAPLPAPAPQRNEVRSVYKQRLAESAPHTAALAPASGPSPAPAAAPEAAQAMGVGLAAPTGGNAATDRPTVSVQVADIYFAHGSASLDVRDRRVLREVIALQKARGGRIRVVGHSSHRTGSMDLAEHKLANFAISVARANAVAYKLVQLGADRDVVMASARADLDPVYREIMPNGEAGNRRAEVYLDY